jgi:hypothetical protein
MFHGCAGPYRTDTASKFLVAGSVIVVELLPISIVPDCLA